MNIKWIEVERYKGFRNSTRLEVRPFTILVGRNNAGKSALAKAVSLLAAALDDRATLAEPLPLAALGLEHGNTFQDLVHARAIHGSVRIAAGWDWAGKTAMLDARVQSVVAGPGSDPDQVITKWSLKHGAHSVELSRVDVDPGRCDYTRRVDHHDASTISIDWRGLRPLNAEAVPKHLARALNQLRGVRHESGIEAQ